MSFENDLKRMEEITDLLKDEKTGLEEAIKLYEEAAGLGKKLNKTLSEIKRKIEIVTSEDEGELATAPFKDNAGDAAASDKVPF